MNRDEFIHKKEQFLEFLTHERRASVHTRRSYLTDLEQLGQFWYTQEKQDQCQKQFEEILSQFVASLFHEIHTSSVARKISCLNSFKKFLIKQGIIVNQKLKRPFVKPKEPITLPIEHILSMMDSTMLHDLPTKLPLRDRAIIELLYATGMRCSELVNIELSVIAFDSRTIVVRSKNQKERVVVFGTKALERIKDYLKFERSEPQSPHERLFLNYRSKPLTVRSVQRICAMFRQCFEHKQLITPYVLRHSFATHLLKNGADIETVQELLGHKTRASTERYIQKLVMN